MNASSCNSRRFAAALVVLAKISPAATADATVDAPTGTAIDVQVDPTPLFLHGYAIEAGIRRGRHRGFVTAIGYDVPSLIAEDKRFDERRDYLVGAGYEVFFTRRDRGPFAGVNVGLTHSTFELERTGGTATTDTVKATLRLGWMFHPLSAVPDLFLAPWVGPSLSFSPEAFMIDGDRIRRKTIAVTGAIQLGWRFSL